ncbi:uncharacterized protein LY89DRAFT_682982 [Mollisia scopiformis]|uniref:Uncharacterized protein n=1 Tax=Mollisia scopiformis TaxID=149040 RepID=A0A194XJ68_MOLSC|nr:uncharacterized protein LY89DRAFT_682982 [Mollisia scopiformis]KUJ20208.1 hypothetical protein LY89DRAFT_682982 [Mollisia scopiformis]
MTWFSALSAVFYYCSLPITTILSWLLVPLAPFLYLGQYIIAGCLLPLTLLSKLETVYIYLGVAAVIGLFTGTVLYLSSSMLESLFNLTPSPDDNGRTAASVRATREKEKLEQVWQSSIIKEEDGISMEKYAEWVERNTTQRSDDHGLLSQTILEEDDDSEDGF